jgi:hypothetical protein
MLETSMDSHLFLSRQFGRSYRVIKSLNARYLADGLAIAEKNFNRDIDLSRTMINKLAEGLSRFNSDVSREVLYAEQLEELLARASASFESRIRVIEDRKGIKRGIFS